jgi:DNA-binding transcriptional MerR regulator
MGAPADRKIPNKLFFKIGEVCEITDTQPYVLRYWESEFPALAPAKNSSGQRIYRRRDIETVLRIKQLLYEEGFTIAGAKKRLEVELAGRAPTPGSVTPGGSPAPEPPLPQPTPNPTLPAPEAAASAPAPNESGSPASGGEDLRVVLRQLREGLRDILTLLDRDGTNRG